MRLIFARKTRQPGFPGHLLDTVKFDPLPDYGPREYEDRICAAAAVLDELILGRNFNTDGTITLIFGVSLKEVKAQLRAHHDLPELVRIMPDVAEPPRR